MTGEAIMPVHGPLTIETKLDPAEQPFLYDHQIEGTPVLPGVMGIEAFAEAALAVLPGWYIEAIEDVDFLAPFKFYRGEPRVVTVEAVFHEDGGGMVADCRLIGKRSLANQAAPQVTTHFTARVRLTRAQPQASVSAAPGAPAGDAVSGEEIYRVYFHGPAYRVVERCWRDGGRVVGRMAQPLPDNHCPAGQPLEAAPRLIELCFQTAGLWEMGVKSRMGLPHHIDRVRFYSAAEQAPLAAVVTPAPDGAAFGAEVVDAAGNVRLAVSGYRTAELPNAVGGEPLKALERAMGAEIGMTAGRG
jgi:hypothetical protein